MEVSSKGFSLVELVVGIVVMGVVLSGIIPIMGALEIKSVEPVFQVKADLLANRIYNQMKIRAYDEKSDHQGGECRCGETVSYRGVEVCNLGACTGTSEFGPDGDEKDNPRPENFNDVDDFDTTSLCGLGSLSAYCYGNSNRCGEGNSSCSKINTALCGNKECLIPAVFFVDNSHNDSCSFSGGSTDIACNSFENFFVKIKVASENVNQAGLDSVTVKKITISVLSPRDDTFVYQFIRSNY